MDRFARFHSCLRSGSLEKSQCEECDTEYAAEKADHDVQERIGNLKAQVQSGRDE
jgi:hypothetical protein